MKREIDFVKLSPAQNMTILVKTRLAADEYARIAAKMMSYDSVYAEQVGFIEQAAKPEAAAHLHMAGGEFCGNACMALAALLASEQGMNRSDSLEIALEASGTEQLVICQVKKIREAYRCQVAMPIPVKIERQTVTYEDDDLPIAIVRYSDFFHLVIEVEQFDAFQRQRAQSLARLLGVTFGASLIGVLLFKPDSNEMAPLIYVPPLGSMVWEKGCGSGTASLGAYLAWQSKGAIAAPIRQPGGTIHVTADYSHGEVTGLKIEGTVDIVAQGKAYIEV